METKSHIMKTKSHIRLLSLFLVAILLLFNSSCNPNDPNNPTSSTTVKDVDGNVYHTIKIGTQTWMVENLKTTKYNDGKPITKITEWSDSLGVGQYCNYNNDEITGNKYGRLYNCTAVLTGKLAPKGWHIPTTAEWIILKNYASANIGNSGSALKALASATDWVSSTHAGSLGFDLTINNSTGFTALPGGIYRGGNLNDISIGTECALYSSDIQESTYNGVKYLIPIGFYATNYSEDIYIDYLDVGFYVSVRCIKD